MDKNGIKCEQIAKREPCQNFKCKHNIFYEKIFIKTLNPKYVNEPRFKKHKRLNHAKPHPNTFSEEIGNCMLNFHGYEGLTLEEIGELYGFDGHERVRQIIDEALKKLKKRNPALKEYLSPDRVIPSEKINIEGKHVERFT